MTSLAIIPYGGTFEQSYNGSVWATIPEVKGIPFPSDKPDYLDVTSLDSPNRRREFIVGLIDINGQAE